MDKTTVVHIPSDLHKKLKLLAARKETKLHLLVAEFLTAALTQKG